MVRKFNILLILCTILFVFSGCEEFYTFNLFEGLDYVKLPSAEDLDKKTTQEGLDYLSEEISSDSFIDKIAEDPEAQEVVATYLEEIYTDPEEEEADRAQAAVLAADFQLGINGSDDLIDNVFNALVSLQDVDSGESANDDQAALQDMLEGIMPPSVTELETPAEQEEAFSDIVIGMLAAAGIYETLGNDLLNLPDDGEHGISGDTLMNAVVAGMLDTFVAEMLEPSYANDPELAAGVLWDVYQAALIDQTDLSGIDGFDVTGEMTTSVADLEYLGNIAAAAGSDLSTFFGTTE